MRASTKCLSDRLRSTPNCRTLQALLREVSCILNGHSTSRTCIHTYCPSQIPSVTPEELQEYKSLKEWVDQRVKEEPGLVDPEDPHALSATVLIRCLRARDLHQTHARTLVEKTLRWRLAHRPWSLVNE